MIRKSLIIIPFTLCLIITDTRILWSQTGDPAFNFAVGTKYYSRFTAYGINLSGDNPAWGLNAGLEHSSGLYGDIYYIRSIQSSNDEQQVALDMGYQLEFSPRFLMYAELTHYQYSSDTLHAFAQFSNSFSLNANFDLSIIDIGLSFDRFFGGSGATYFSVDISTFQHLGPLYLLPMMQVVFMSQTVEERYLDKGKGKKKDDENLVTTTLTGLSSTILTVVTILPVVENLNITLVPSLIFYHQSELSVDSVQFIWNAGIRYRIYF